MLLAAIALLALSQPDVSHPMPETRHDAKIEVRRACAADYQRICPRAIGKQQLRACVKANKTSLSPHCREARYDRKVAKHEAKMAGYGH